MHKLKKLMYLKECCCWCVEEWRMESEMGSM